MIDEIADKDGDGKINFDEFKDASTPVNDARGKIAGWAVHLGFN